jgi:hypothetical protein
MNPSRLNPYIMMILLGVFIGYCLGTATAAHAYTTYYPPVIPDYKFTRYHVTPVPQMRYIPQYRPVYNYPIYRPTYISQYRPIQMQNTAAGIHSSNLTTYWKISNTPMGYTIKPN